MSKPILYIMCGLPFAGKSWLARKLADEFGWTIVEIDEIKASYGLRDVWREMKPKDWDKIFNNASEQVRTALGQGKSVIYDSTNHTKESRDQLRTLARGCACRSIVIFNDISSELASERWQENKQNKERMDLPKWAFDTALSDYQSPLSEPDVISYIQNEDFEKFCKKF